MYRACSVSQVNSIYKMDLMNKTHMIQAFLNQRGVTRLCHMTQIEKIIEMIANGNGIVANEFLQDFSKFINDHERLDGKNDYVSTSIQYPNTWYYRNKKDSIPGMKDWAVIFINPYSCIDINSIFCPVNSAKGRGQYIGKDIEVLIHSFDKNVRGRERLSSMLANCPTDDQAEVMIYHSVLLRDFMGIAFENEAVLNRFLKLSNRRNLDLPSLYIAPELFDTSLSTKIRCGIVPEERLVREESFLWQIDLCS